MILKKCGYLKISALELKLELKWKRTSSVVTYPKFVKKILDQGLQSTQSGQIWFCSIKGGSRLPEKFALSAWLKALENDEKRFLFHLRSTFWSEDIYIFDLTFSVMQENGLVRNLRLISAFVASQLGKQTIKIYILVDISK